MDSYISEWKDLDKNNGNLTFLLSFLDIRVRWLENWQVPFSFKPLGFVALWFWCVCGCSKWSVAKEVDVVIATSQSSVTSQACSSILFLKDPELQYQNDSRGQKPEKAFSGQFFPLTVKQRLQSALCFSRLYRVFSDLQNTPV